MCFFHLFHILIYLCAFSSLVSLGQWFKVWVQGPVPVKIVVQNWPTSVFMILLQTGMSEKNNLLFNWNQDDVITLTPKRNFGSSHKLGSPINSLQGRETWSVRGDISDIAGKFKQCQQKQIKENRKSPFSLKMLMNLSAKKYFVFLNGACCLIGTCLYMKKRFSVKFDWTCVQKTLFYSVGWG